jgi:hypothetical protein
MLKKGGAGLAMMDSEHGASAGNSRRGRSQKVGARSQIAAVLANGCRAGRRMVRLDYFNSNSAISMRVVPMLRTPRVVPGSCQ